MNKTKSSTSLKTDNSNFLEQEFITLFTIFEENNSPYRDYSIKNFTQDPSSVNGGNEDRHDRITSNEHEGT